MNNSPRKPDETPLDAVLESAAKHHRSVQAPDGFSKSVMARVAVDEAAGPNEARGASAHRTSGLLQFRLWVAAALVLAAFFAGWALSPRNTAQKAAGAGSGESTARRTDESPRRTLGEPSSSGDHGDVTIQDLKNEMGAGAAANDRKTANGSGAGAIDQARPPAGVPSTLAGRFPRSADRRVYCAIDLPSNEVSFGPFLLAPLPAGASIPSIAGFAARMARLPVSDAEKLLKAIDSKYNKAVQPCLAAFSGTLVPVQGVVTQPRPEEAPQQASASNPSEGDAVEVVIYTRAN
jgi:hypothetical protein